MSCFDKIGVASRNCVTTFGCGYRELGSPDGSLAALILSSSSFSYAKAIFPGFYEEVSRCHG